MQIKAVSCSLCTAFPRNWDFQIQGRDDSENVVLKLNLLSSSLYPD